MDKLDLIIKELKELNKRISSLESELRMQQLPPDYSNDPIIIDAINFIRDKEKVSASDLQRKFDIGYARSARILDELIELGFVNESNDGKAKKSVSKEKFVKLSKTINKIKDPLLIKAIDIISQSDRASASLLQRRLRIGYAKAAKILDELEKYGYVGPAMGSLPRLVLIKKNDK